MKLANNDWKVPQLEMSGEEICILCSFLGIPVVYGIHVGWLSAWNSNLRETVINHGNQMESKGIFYCDLNGIIHINAQVYEVMQCIGLPNKVMMINQKDSTAKTNDYYIFENEKHCIGMKCQKNNIYSFYYLNEKLKIEKTKDICAGLEQIYIPISTLKKAKVFIESFDLESAKELLSKNIKEDPIKNTQFLLDILRNKVVFQSICFWEWRERSLIRKEKMDYVLYKDKKFMICENETYMILQEIS